MYFITLPTTRKCNDPSWKRKFAITPVTVGKTSDGGVIQVFLGWYEESRGPDSSGMYWEVRTRIIGATDFCVIRSFPAVSVGGI